MVREYKQLEEEPQMASEAVAAYAVQQEQPRMFLHVAKDYKDVESFASKICANEENLTYHMLQDFYKDGIAEDVFLSEQQLVESLDKADSEGYISEEETKRLMKLWQFVD